MLQGIPLRLGKKDLLASLCLGLRVCSINLVLNDSEDSTQLLSNLLRQMIWLKKKKAVVISIQERALLTSPAAQADLCSITPTRISSSRHRGTDCAWWREDGCGEHPTGVPARWLTTVGMGVRKTVPVCSNCQISLKEMVFRTPPGARPSFGPLQMCPVASRYPAVAGSL